MSIRTKLAIAGILSGACLSARESKMKLVRSIFACSAALFLGLAGQAQASNISFFDLTDGVPTFTATSDIDIITVISSPEHLHIDAVLHIPFGNGRIQNAPGAATQAFLLLDADGTQSDWVLFQAGASSAGPVDFLENFTVDFQSDPFLSPPPSGASTIVEDGTLQALPFDSSGLRGGSFFGISVQSDVVEVPEPHTLALVCLGLVGLGLSWRKRAS